MATVKRFEDLNVWKVSRELFKHISVLIDSGILKNNFRFINQLEGSSGSVMDNIAEGFERGSRGEFIQFLGYSKGSSGELRSQLYRLLDRNYISQEQFDEYNLLAIRVSIMIQKMISYLQNTKLQGTRRKL